VKIWEVVGLVTQNTTPF